MQSTATLNFKPCTGLSPLQVALFLASLGLPVFPVVAGGKIPAIKGWQNRASTNPDQIRAWWVEIDPVLGVERIRDFNVGIRTGRLPDGRYLVVIDVDVKAGARGVESLDRLDMERGTPGWLTTLIVETPSKGLHYYFTADRPAATTASRLGPGLDTRGEGGYVLAPGSIVNGVPYRHRDGEAIEAPGWLLDAIGEPAPREHRGEMDPGSLDSKASLDRGEAWLRSDSAPSASIGVRGSTAYRVAAKLKDFGISELAALEMMAEHWNDERCSPPMEFEDLAASVAHAFEYGKRPVGADNPTADFGPVDDDEIEIPVQGAAPPRKPIRPTPFVWRDPRTIPPRQWLYGRHFVRTYATATVAPSGLGKSTVELVEAVVMATGRPLLGLLPRGRSRVWYWNGEDPREEIERRLAAILIHFEIPPAEVEGWLFTDSGRDTPMVVAETVGGRVTVSVPVVEDLEAGLRDLRIDVLIIDPFISSHGVPENDNGAIDRVVKTWARIANDCDCCVELVHHVRKRMGGQAGDHDVDDARGAGSMIGAVRSARVLNSMSEKEAERFGIEPDRRRLFFRVDNGKANMAPPAEHAVWRQLIGVNLDNGTDEDAADDVGVATLWSPPTAMDWATTADLRKVQTVLSTGTWAENVQASNWAGYAVAEALELPHESKAERQRIAILIKGWVAAGALRIERQHSARDGREKPVVVVGEAA